MNFGSLILRARETFREAGQLRDAASTLVVRVASAVLGYLLQITLAQTMDLKSYGIYATLWTWLIIANHVSVLGFSESALRFIPRYQECGRDAWVWGFYRTGFRMVIFGSTVTALLILGGLYFASGAMDSHWVIAIGVLALGLPVMTMELYMEGVARSLGRYMLAIVPSFIVRPIAICLSVLAAHKMEIEPTAAVVLGIAAAVTFATIIWRAISLRRSLIERFGKPAKTKSHSLWVKASLPLAIIVTAEELFFWFDILILSVLVPPEDISIYFAALRSMALAVFVQHAFMMVSSRGFSMAAANRDRAVLQARIAEATNWTFLLTVPSVVATLAIGHFMLSLFGNEFQAGCPVMVVLGVGLIVRASTGQAVDLLNVLGHQKTNLKIVLSCLVSNILISVALVPMLGIIGAAYGTTATYILRGILLTYSVHKQTGLWVLVGGLPRGLTGAIPPSTTGKKE